MAAVATGVPPLGPADAELFAAARLVAARQQPYLAAALFALVPVAQPGLGTFAVDKYWRVYLDMDAARRWGVPAAAAVLVRMLRGPEAPAFTTPTTTATRTTTDTTTTTTKRPADDRRPRPGAGGRLPDEGDKTQ